METAEKVAKLHQEVQTLWDEMFDIVAIDRLNPLATDRQRAKRQREYAELGDTLLTKVRAVKYYRTVGDTYLKILSGPDTGDLLELVDVGALELGAAGKILLVELEGWVAMLIHATPITRAEYYEGLFMALDAGMPVLLENEFGADEGDDVRRCRVCGCTDENCSQCVKKRASRATGWAMTCAVPVGRKEVAVMIDLMQVGVQKKRFADFKEDTQAALARVIKAELEERLAVATRDVGEWVRVLVLANPVVEMDHALGKFDLGEGKDTADRLAREYLLLDEQRPGPADFEAAGFALCEVCGDPLMDSADDGDGLCDQCKEPDDEDDDGESNDAAEFGDECPSCGADVDGLAICLECGHIMGLDDE